MAATLAALSPAGGGPTSAPAPPPNGLYRSDTDAMNTIPDPRSPSPAVGGARNGAGSTPNGLSPDGSHHPDLSSEVAMLSTKLINAINTQTTLDDSLQATRHELEGARKRVAELEGLVNDHRRAVDQGFLVRREEFTKMEGKLKAELAEERKQRAVVEKDKKTIEFELENLTTALFEEANTMVAVARRDTEAAEKRNEQLKTRLSEREELLNSQQEQLQDLKVVMEKMSSERDENETNTHQSTAPSTPALAPHDRMSRVLEAVNLTPNTPGSDEVPANHPLHFSHLLHPVLRDDIPAYEDFQALLKAARNAAPSSRVNSGNFGSLANALGAHSSGRANASSTSLHSQSPKTPGVNGNGNGNGHSSGAAATSANNGGGQPGSAAGSPRESAFVPPLKEAKFYKRALSEDIEPTLRLDIAPGLSWLARRTVLNAMTAGSLAVEPQPPAPKFRGPVFACALCGENRVGETWARRFRFRTSEQPDAQRYPLCDYCLHRVRAACDYVAFLRLVNGGHWRADTPEEEKAAWEEGVRLRERMFWARVGGGVVPAFVVGSPTAAAAAKGSHGRLSEEKKGEDPFKEEGGDSAAPARGKRVSIGRTVISPDPEPEPKLKREGAEETKGHDAAALKAPGEKGKEDEGRKVSSDSAYSQDEMPQTPHQQPAETMQTAGDDDEQRANDARAEQQLQEDAARASTAGDGGDSAEDVKVAFPEGGQARPEERKDEGEGQGQQAQQEEGAKKNNKEGRLSITIPGAFD
ncbi:hypothetical protein BDY21DRAFT_170714 [Lineolata rhizophorae]|uniref:GDP/GTP exchange factor Sec2 N-terminal domain-containing protein n=1 Tax=Lineolata rhizophorae TaxID=578093 RepID=A0A6A6P9R1_9PEZI|nr:hypothetical protein BDY21DRAFT_170714 [Lineolata rhizophorae]